MNEMQQMPQAPQQGEQTNPKEIHERFVTNAMSLASADQYDQMMGIAKSANNPTQALGRALYFVLMAVKKGLEDKGVQIPGELWLAKNGLIDQTARIVAALLEKAGIAQNKDTVTKAIEFTAQAMAEGGEQQGDAGEQAQEAQQVPQQAPQQATPQGLLSRGMQA